MVNISMVLFDESETPDACFAVGLDGLCLLREPVSETYCPTHSHANHYLPELRAPLSAKKTPNFCAYANLIFSPVSLAVLIAGHSRQPFRRTRPHRRLRLRAASRISVRIAGRVSWRTASLHSK
jgi:hypothetical protein